MAMNELTTTLAVQPVGGPSAVLEYGGLRWLTDPSLSPPETTLPAVQPDAILPIDVVLLWHDHHGDNIDAAGRELLPRAGRVLTTVAGARRLGGNAVGLRPWSSVELAGPDGSAIRVTAVPASAWSGRQRCCHGARDWIPARGAWGRERYVSGDNASLGVVREIAQLAGPIGVAVVFVGALQRAQERACAYLTLASDHVADAAKILGVRRLCRFITSAGRNFTQGADRLRGAFGGNGVSDRLALAKPGARIEL